MFFINHFAFSFVLLASLFGTLLYKMAPCFCRNCLMVSCNSFNLGTFGFAIFIHQSFIECFLSILFSLPALFFCERYYGVSVTILVILLAGLYFGLVGLIVGRDMSGFYTTGHLLTCMACFYGFHWYGIIIGIVLLISSISIDSQEIYYDKVKTFAAIAGIIAALLFGKISGRFGPGNPRATSDSGVLSTFITPIQNSFYISSAYGLRNDPKSGRPSFHGGIDLACNEGTAVDAACQGQIVGLGYDDIYGNYIVISHNNGYQTKYAHLKQVFVNKGDYVSQGQMIGSVGSTGYSTGPHLHYMVIKNGKTLNPEKAMN